MAANDRPQDPSTPRAVAAEAQSREETRPADASSEVAGRAPPVEAPGLNLRYQFGKNVARAAAQPYKREKDDPVYRPLRIYAIDPSASRLAGAIATINVPYERLEPGPVGKRFSVDNEDGELHLKYRRVDLDDAALLIKGGQDPTPSDPRFHPQMV